MRIRNHVSTLCLLISSILVITSCTKNSIKCTLKGEVIDRPQSNQLILLKQGEDPRIHGINIPITEGKFEYILNCDYEELYEFVFNEELERGGFRPIPFFSEHGVINFTLNPTDQFDKNIVEGGTLNKEYFDYYSKLLDKHKEIGNELNAKYEQLNKDGIDFSFSAKALHDSASQALFNWQLQYVKEQNPTIVGYSILVSATSSMVQQNQDIFPYYDVYQTIFDLKYPNHPYTKQMKDLFTGSSLKAGTPFIDFSTININGESVRLSDMIAGKPAVLHLWASWCGPCRQKGKELIPVYEEFRDKGFVVIGVAREKSISTAEAAMNQDKYPWGNFVELNDTEQIWVKYGIGNSGGCVFLIDEKGIVVKVAPTSNEIRNFLLNRL